MTPPAGCDPTPEWRVIVGPPGTGKTSRLLDLLAETLAGGVPPSAIAFFTFTRAARDEARERVRTRFGLGSDDLVHFRTIHAEAYRLLGLHPGQVMTHEAWKEFGDRYGYTFSRLAAGGEPEIAELPRTTSDDLLRFAYSWGMNRRLDPSRTLRLCPVDVSPKHFPVFLERLARFKADGDRVDFPDMLVTVLERSLRPAVRVAFVDEGQDLSPLQIAEIESWLSPCERVFVAGDDDQAIYRFQGAEPDWLLGLTKTHSAEVLVQSHRLPATVFRLAQEIIGQNRTRIDKRYEPTTRRGVVEWVEQGRLVQVLDPAADTLLLARNREFLEPIARRLFEGRIPYLVEGAGGISPLSDPNVVHAIQTSVAIFCGQPVDARGLEALLKFIPSRGCDLLPHGVKQRVKELTTTISVDTMRGNLGLGRLLDRIRSKGPVDPLIKLPASERAYLQELVARYGTVPIPKIRLTTIHGAKGREADTVAVIPDLSRASYEEYTDYSRGGFEAENRVAYVAVTRAKRRLILVRPRTRRFYDYPVLPPGPEADPPGDAIRSGVG